MFFLCMMKMQAEHLFNKMQECLKIWHLFSFISHIHAFYTILLNYFVGFMSLYSQVPYVTSIFMDSITEMTHGCN